MNVFNQNLDALHRCNRPIVIVFIFHRNMLVAKSVISGTLAVNDDLTLHVNKETIDAIFNDGDASSL